jgi:hypothetical protein
MLLQKKSSSPGWLGKAKKTLQKKKWLLLGVVDKSISLLQNALEKRQNLLQDGREKEKKLVLRVVDKIFELPQPTLEKPKTLLKKSQFQLYWGFVSKKCGVRILKSSQKDARGSDRRRTSHLHHWSSGSR